MKKICFILLLIGIGCKQNPSSKTNSVEKNFAKSFNADLKTTLFGNNEKAGKFYKVRGISMYVETYGTGEPLLLIHGNGGSINNFIYQIEEFSKQYKVIAVDSRSQGKSIDRTDSLSYEMMADDFADLLKQMKAGPANVVGWSDGGINALLLALRHPEAVKKIVLTGANVFPDKSAFAGNEWENMNKGFAAISQKMKSADPKTAADSLSYKLQKLMAENPHISASELKRITNPALVISGDNDMIAVSHTVYIYENLPNAQLWIVPNSGHATLVTHATVFNRTVLDFFGSEFLKRNNNERFF